MTGGFDGTRLDGSVDTGFLGADGGSGRWLAGLALPVSESEYGRAQMEGEDRGEVERSLTQIRPCARLSVSDTVELWRLAAFPSANARQSENRPAAVDFGSESPRRPVT